MFKLYSLILTLFTLLICNFSYALNYSFDYDNDGWQQTYIGYNGNPYEQMYPVTDANWLNFLDGHQGVIYQMVNDNPEGRAYWLGVRDQETAFLGDLTGATLTTDIYSTGNWQTYVGNNVYARWVIADLVYTDSNGIRYYNMWISKSFSSINMNSFTGWSSFSIKMVEENFMKWPNYSTAGTFADVLKNYDQLGFYLFSDTDNIECINGGSCTWGDNYTLLHYGAFAQSGNATWAIDNFHAVPEPSTFILMVGAGCLVICFRSFSNKK